MNNPTPNEIEAMRDASDKAGAFIEGTGKTDLSAFEAQEWEGLIETICDGYIDGMQQRARLWFREKEPPF